MRQDHVRNLLLGIITLLLLMNLGDRLIPPAHAFGTKHYRSIEVTQAREVQKALDIATAEGWEYVGSIDHVMIFKKFSF